MKKKTMNEAVCFLCQAVCYLCQDEVEKSLSTVPETDSKKLEESEVQEKVDTDWEEINKRLTRDIDDLLRMENNQCLTREIMYSLKEVKWTLEDMEKKTMNEAVCFLCQAEQEVEKSLSTVPDTDNKKLEESEVQEKVDTEWEEINTSLECNIYNILHRIYKNRRLTREIMDSSEVGKLKLEDMKKKTMPDAEFFPCPTDDKKLEESEVLEKVDTDWEEINRRLARDADDYVLRMEKNQRLTREIMDSMKEVKWTLKDMEKKTMTEAKFPPCQAELEVEKSLSTVSETDDKKLEESEVQEEVDTEWEEINRRLPRDVDDHMLRVEENLRLTRQIMEDVKWKLEAKRKPNFMYMPWIEPYMQKSGLK